MAIINLSLSELSKLIHARKLSVLELIQAYIHQIEKVNPKINALIKSNFEFIIEQARLADKKLFNTKTQLPFLFGIPFTVKDLYSVENKIVTCGTLGLANNKCNIDAEVISRLKQQGCILLGLTNTPELGLSLETDNLIYGRTNHPLDNNYASGGSSGGEAALIAAGGSPMGLAGDHGGGARHPAHVCGIVTLRPSLGRLPQTGSVMAKRGWTFLTSRIAPMARSVEDVRNLFHAIEGPDGLDPYAERPFAKTKIKKPIRIANLIDKNFMNIDAAIPKALDKFTQTLQSKQYHVEFIETDLIEQGFQIAKQLFQADAGKSLRVYLEKLGTKKTTMQTQAWLESLPKKPLSLSDYLALWAKWDEYKIQFLSLFKKHDILLCPVSSQCAQPHGSSLQPHALWPLIRYTASVTLTECPVVVVPCGKNNNGFPIGVQVIAKPWQDELALDVAEDIYSQAEIPCS